jgi:NADH-quinone oxidoreductase subunit G
MTMTQNKSAEIVDLITVVIDGFEVAVPKGTLVIRAAEKLHCLIRLVLVASA